MTTAAATLDERNINPVDWFNRYGDWNDCFTTQPFTWKSDTHICIGRSTNPCLVIHPYGIAEVIEDVERGLIKGKQYTKFMLLTLLRFKGNYRQAISWIEYYLMNRQSPYIRIGTDYFKVITKRDHYGIRRKTIKHWKKEEIKQDHGAAIFNVIPRYDDFCIVPDNINYEPIVDNCYNLYSPFSHKPVQGDVSKTISFLHHIFGNQLELGLTYLQVLYQLPKQILPILCLVSSERQTGKTTFINWIQMIFGDNFIGINPEDLSSQFNAMYSTKNIISIDETVVDRASSVEKLKHITTAKSISVNQKHVANYELPFYGKVIINSNKVKDFMRIDDEEIRFWVRKIDSVDTINTNIEQDLRSEIPAFLHLLSERSAVDTSRSRMVFTTNDLKTEALDDVKRESRSSLCKELQILIDEFFLKNDLLDSFKATPSDIKTVWFQHNNQISIHYIAKVIKEEMRLKPQEQQRYTASLFAYKDSNGSPHSISKNGYPFEFLRPDYIKANPDTVPEEEPEEEPF